jgi:C4-dicarboxylate transporter, DctM subunit
MAPITIGFIGVGALILILFSGIPVGFAMGIVGLCGMIALSGWNAGLGILKTVPYTTVASYDLSPVPLFILMGEFCFYAGLTQDLYFTANKWLGHLPGGLAMATVGACAGFAAVCGSSMATAATMGTVALPEMKKYGYSPALATGVVAAGGTLGILIPPSLVFIVYGLITGQSIGRLFIAGLVPGILEAFIYIAIIYVVCRIRPKLGQAGSRARLKDMIFSLNKTWGVLVLFLLVIGGIYMGVFSPSEAAAIGAFGALLFALGKKRLNWKVMKSSLMSSGKTSAMMITIIIGAYLLSYFLAVTRLPTLMADTISGLAVNRYIILGGILFTYLILGCFMDSVAMLLITMPVYFPIIKALGFDPIWFGVISVIMVEIGLITPPVGLNVFVIAGMDKAISMSAVYRGVSIFVVADLILVVLLTAWPQVVLILPNLMKS